MSAAAVALIGGAAAILSAIARTAVLRRVRRAVAAHPVHVAAQDGVILGAEGLRLHGAGDRGVLLLHGFNDTPQSVASLARGLHLLGWTVFVPRLSHHGRADGENSREGTAAAWIAGARDEWIALRAHVPRVVLAGQSMGGAIAAILAVEDAPAALVLLAPYVAMGRVARTLAAVWPITSIVLPAVLSDPTRGIRDPVARTRSLAGRQFTPRMLNELRRVVNRADAALPLLTVPTLMIQGRTDYRIPSGSAQRAFDRLGCRDKTLVWVDNVGHVLAADSGAAEVCARAAEWLDERIPLE
jgi:carboxylesterase